MPELPEVETVRQGLIPVMEGKRLANVIQRRPNLRWPFPANTFLSCWMMMKH
jgi:formamidopyrimidine-DNA glycosylase